VELAGRYQLEALLGEGAMGRVYRARQTALNKSFAIKILHPHLTHDAATHARFASEAQNAASLNHPNVVSVVDYGRSDEGITYIVMEHVEGRSLEDIIAGEFPLGRVRIVDLTVQILAALAEAHGLRILHRDLKPENILVQSLRTHGELLKVVDFGIAKLMDSGPSQAGLTSQGIVCGTPEFMSPEQARGLSLDGRSDLYAVGVILYQMLTGRVPFESEAAVDILHRHIHETPIPPSEVLGTEPDAIEAACLKAMAKDRESRFATAVEFRDALVAANAAASETVYRCRSCDGPLRPDDRFCAACGGPVSRAETQPTKRRPTRRSGLNLRAVDSEQTAEVVVRTFPMPFVGRPLLEKLSPRFAVPNSELVSQLIQGAPGMGKTRLVDEIAAVAEGHGWQVVGSGCDPTGAARSLWPIREVVGQLLRLDPRTLTTRDLGRASNVVGLSFEALPGLTELFGLGGPASDAELAVRRRECFASAVQTMLGAGGSTPTLVIFDDVDRFDTPSRRIVQKLARARIDRPVFVLIASQEEDMSWLRGPLEVLTPLDPNSVEGLVRLATRDVNPDSELPRTMAGIGPTTPLHLELVLRIYAETQELRGEDSDPDLIRRRIDALNDAQRRVLEAASVMGECVADEDIRVLVSVEAGAPSGWSIDEALAALHVQGLLVICSKEERAFPSRLIREVTRGAIDEARLRVLHRECAVRVASVLGARTLVAMHALRGAAADASNSLEDSARAAARSFDDAKAVSLFKAATRVYRRSTALDRDERLAALTAEMAVPMCYLGDHEGAIKAIKAILPKASSPPIEGSLYRALGRAQLRARHPERAVEALQRALGPVIASGDPATILDLYAELAGALVAADQPEQALKEAKEGLDMCTLGQGPRAEVGVPLWRYLLRIASLQRKLGHLKEARNWCEHALYQAEQRGDNLGLLRSHVEMAWLLRDLEQNTLAEQHLARSLEHARHFGDRLTTAEILLERARHRASRGKLEDARRCLDEALRLARIIEWKDGIGQAAAALETLQALEQ
jgi:serine/threonine-protein kinase